MWDDNDEGKVVEKPCLWVESRRTSGAERGRKVGWRGNSALTGSELHDILEHEKQARDDFRNVRKAIGPGKPQEEADPLAGLPPTWQAFWSAVPDLDAQAAYKRYRKEQERQEKAQRKVEAEKARGTGAPALQALHAGVGLQADAGVEGLAGAAEAGAPAQGQQAPEDTEEALEAEVNRLKAEVRERRLQLSQKERVVADWDSKLKRVRTLDAEEKAKSAKVVRTLESSSYKHGVEQGKLKSSDQYFKFLVDDAKTLRNKQLATLKRSCALMSGRIDEIKAEYRQLLKEAAEAEKNDAITDDESASAVGGRSPASQHSSGAFSGAF